MKLIIMLFISMFALTVSGQTPVAVSNRAKNDFGDKAVVYFYSLATSTTLGQIRKPVFLDDQEIADIRPERYFIVALPAGKHNFRLKNKKFGGIEMDFAANQTYYIRINWETGGVVKPSGITRVEPESGAFDVKQLRPIEIKNIKNSNLVFTELKN